MRASVAMTASGAGARYKAWGARVQTLLIPLMIAGSVLSSGETVLLPRSPCQVAAIGPKGALKELHPSRRTLERKCTTPTKNAIRSLRRALGDHPEFYLDEFRDYVLKDLGYAPSCSSGGRRGLRHHGHDATSFPNRRSALQIVAIVSLLCRRLGAASGALSRGAGEPWSRAFCRAIVSCIPWQAPKNALLLLSLF